MNTLPFMADCLRINKPCKFEGMAKTWPAYEKWRFINGGSSYLKSTLEEQVTVFIDMDPEINIGEVSGNSFLPDTSQKMKYSEFQEKMSSVAVGVAMKDSTSGLHLLKGDIAEPVFFTEISELAGVDIMQG
jgi:hypothetical protein